MAFNIGPRIGVEGEKELKEALRAIIAEFKTLDAEMKAMEKAFARGEKSQKAYTEYQSKIAAGTETLSKLTEEYSKWLNIASERHGESSSYAERYRTEIAKVGVEQENLKTKAKEASEAEEEFKDSIEETADALSALETTLIAAGVTKGLQAIKDVLLDCAESAKEFETAMAAVSRTTGLKDSGLEEMAETLKELSTEIPITTTELGNIVATAGQLGIKTADLEEFSTVMAKLGTATELSSESASTLLAQLVNITGTDEYEKLGSLMAYLGDATAATTTQIVEMSQSMAASANIAGINERGIAAIAATVASLGIQSQAGGTAMSTLISTIYKAVESGGDALHDFASVAGMTAGEFKAAWGRDAITALDAFIDGLNETERNGKSAISILSELGITNIRQVRAVLGLAEAEGMLTSNIAAANKAWEENTALNEKAGTMYGTTESKFQMFKNSLNNLKIAIGDDLNPALADLAEAGGNAFDWAADFINEHPYVVAAVTGVTTALGLFTAGVTGMLVITKAVAALRTLKTALDGVKIAGLAAIPGAKWIAAIVGVVTTVGMLASSFGDAKKEAKEFKKSIEESKTAFDEEAAALETNATKTDGMISALKRLSAKEEKTAADKEVIKTLVNDLNAELPELALNYDAEADALSRVGASGKNAADTIFEMAEAMNEERQYEAYAERLAQLMGERETLTSKIADAQERLQRNMTDWWASEDIKYEMMEYREALAVVDEEYALLEQEIKNYTTVVNEAGEDTTEMMGILYDTEIALDALVEAYGETYSKIREALDSIGGPLENLVANTEITTAQIGENLSNQVGYWEDYDKNFQSLIEREVYGIDRLAQHFADGSADSAGALSALSTATDEELQEMVNSLDKIDDFKDGLAGRMAEAETGALAAIENLVEGAASKIAGLDLSVDARQMGLNTLQGYINGLNDLSVTLFSKVSGVAAGVIGAFKYTLGISSPSKVFKSAGVDSLQGYINGASEKANAVNAKMKKIADGIVTSFSTPFDPLSSFTFPITDGISDRMGGVFTGNSNSNVRNTTTTNIGKVTFTINSAAGQSPQEIADVVMERMQTIVAKKGMALA